MKNLPVLFLFNDRVSRETEKDRQFVSGEKSETQGISLTMQGNLIYNNRRGDSVDYEKYYVST